MRPYREIPFGLGSPRPCAEDATAGDSHAQNAQGVQGPEDMELLRRYAEQGDTGAFETIVQRHIGWVFNMCRRGLRDRHLAEDAAQAVFTILSRKASVLPEGTKLSGWLFKTTRFAINDARKIEFRYRRRQEVAAEFARQELSAAEKETFDRLEPELDEALAKLSDKDRQAVLMHFYEGLSLDEVAVKLEVSREGAKKRVYRAVEKLRVHFKKKGAAVSAPVVVALLVAQTSEGAIGSGAAVAGAVGATAPAAGLAYSITAGATGAAVPSGMSTAITEGVARTMVVGTGKLLKAVLAGQFAALAIIGGGTYWHATKTPTAVGTQASVVVTERQAVGSAPVGGAVVQGTVQKQPARVSEPERKRTVMGAGVRGPAYQGGANLFEGPERARDEKPQDPLRVAIEEVLKDVSQMAAEAEPKGLKLDVLPEEDEGPSLAVGGGTLGFVEWGELEVRSFEPREWAFNTASAAGAVSPARAGEMESGVFTPVASAGVDKDVDVEVPGAEWGVGGGVGTGGGKKGGGHQGGVKPFDPRAVPEPGLMGLMGMGAVLALRRRKRVG